MGRFDLGYAQARIQARHGARPDGAFWRQLHTSRDLPHLLDSARASSLDRWLRPITESSDVHEVDRTLRSELRAYVDEVASWLPRAWEPAMKWTAWAVELPLLERLLSDEVPPPWAALEPHVAGFVHPSRSERAAAMRAAELDAIVDAAEAGRSARDGYVARWRELLPGRRGARFRELHELADRVVRHFERMAEEEVADGWELRAELEADLGRTFRWNALRPVAVFAHLALVALDVEKLHGALVRRNLFPNARSEVPWL